MTNLIKECIYGWVPHYVRGKVLGGEERYDVQGSILLG